MFNQLNRGLKKIKNKNNIIVAYEPIWSIGSGIIPKLSDLEKTLSHIETFLINRMRFKNPIILYGGSVNPKNITLLKKVSYLDGFLIGGASQNSNKFIDIIKKTFN